MAYAPTRSMTSELNEGLTDGKYKKAVTDRGGDVDSATYKSRMDLYDLYHGIHEEVMKVRPDDKIVSTPNFVHTPEAPVL